MPGWLWDTVFQYPLAEGDTRTQYSDGSTFVGPLKDGMRHGKGGYFFQDGSRCVSIFAELFCLQLVDDALDFQPCAPCSVGSPRPQSVSSFAMVTYLSWPARVLEQVCPEL